MDKTKCVKRFILLVVVFPVTESGKIWKDRRKEHIIKTTGQKLDNDCQSITHKFENDPFTDKPITAGRVLSDVLFYI